MAEEKAIYQSQTIAEMTGGIILANFEKVEKVRETSYQTEAELEQNFIADLIAQGYQKLDLHTSEQLYDNLKVQIERLNHIEFTPAEWKRFLLEYLDAPNDGIKEKTFKVQESHQHDFRFDNGHVQNIKIIDKQNIHNNFLQVVHQVKQEGTHKNRYDVTVLVNGLPLVHIELKKRGESLQEAFNQIHRYGKESFNAEHSLYKFVQIFVISNGTYTRYFANTTERNKNNYEFTCEWADAKNKVIRDLEDFTRTFFEKRVVLELLTKYCVFNSDKILLIMRPYQIAATERILWKIKSSFENKQMGTENARGFIWHTTGSGKTLSSFKTAQLATSLPFIDKVFFVVDRKDLDYQTMKEYKKFQEDSVNGSKDTKELKQAIEKEDGRIVVTTLQKLNEFVKKNQGHPIYQKHCVFIYDECHRSQFGEAQKNIKKAFKNDYVFGFTGTPIFTENSLSGETTSTIFGAQLHSYVITDAIRDEKVLKFKVDYNNLSPKFKRAEKEQDETALLGLEKKLLHPERIAEITKHILKVYDTKTSRNTLYTVKERRLNGFNAMFAVQSVEAAKMYYEEFQRQQASWPEDKRLKIATIFSYTENEAPKTLGDIEEENFEPTALNSSSKEFLEKVVEDYNAYFKTKFSIASGGFENYYKDLTQKVKDKEVDLLIVVGMFLTGFDAPTLNTLFVDKNLRYHGLIQAYSRTNRILNEVKKFGNIVCFRDLQKATEDAIKTFGDKNSVNIILERSYADYMEGFTDESTGQEVRGYRSIVKELTERFSCPTEIERDADKKDFAQLFGEYLKAENILRNFDEFSKEEAVLTERERQDMKSAYVDIRERLLKEKKGEIPPVIDGEGISKVDFSDVEFQIELLKTDEINLDYILDLILKKSKELDNKDSLEQEVTRAIRSSMSTRSKEKLILDFIQSQDFETLKEVKSIVETFYAFAKEKKVEALKKVITDEKLKDGAELFVEKSLKKGYVDASGQELDELLPPTSRRGGAREKKKQSVLAALQEFVEIFVGI